MKLFLEQMSECQKKGFIKSGKFISFKNHPELRPIHPTNKNVKGFTETLCGRFGGKCHSKHLGCMKLRGIL